MVTLYRRKVLLAILEAFGGELGRTSLQKLLFVLSQRQDNPSYDFVPYKYGAYSFQSYLDMSVLEKNALINMGNNTVSLTKETGFFYEIKTNDRLLINNLVSEFPKANYADLIKYTYEKYPFYALKSQLKEYITPNTTKWLNENLADNNITTLFTIGYESRSLEMYLNELIKNNIKVLIDVRKNAFSMKYGFSKKTLQHDVESVGLKYIHIPTLGIDSDKRQDLERLEDYYKLFDAYERNNLSHNNKDLDTIWDLLINNKKIALTCFEYDKEICHRSRIAKKIQQRNDWQYILKHL